MVNFVSVEVNNSVFSRKSNILLYLQIIDLKIEFIKYINHNLSQKRLRKNSLPVVDKFFSVGEHVGVPSTKQELFKCSYNEYFDVLIFDFDY